MTWKVDGGHVTELVQRYWEFSDEDWFQEVIWWKPAHMIYRFTHSINRHQVWIYDDDNCNSNIFKQYEFSCSIFLMLFNKNTSITVSSQ